MGCLRDCSTGVIKCILFLFNIVILICAVLLVVVGALALNNTFEYNVNNVAIFAIVLGVIIALIAFCGCWGAISNGRCLLTTYAAVLITIFIIQIALAVVAFVAIKNTNLEFDNDVEQYLRNLYTNYTTNTGSAGVINAIQEAYKCCGLNGPSGSEVVISGSTIIPTCCTSTTTCTTTSSDLYTDGCLTLVQDTLRTLYQAAGGIAIGFGVVELVAALFALYARPKN